MIFLGLLLRGLLRLLTRLAFATLVLLTLAKVVSFALALWAEHHVDAVERLASRMFGMPVHVARIETSWRGFTPRIWLRDLVLGDEERLQIGDVLAAVSLRALPHWQENLPVALHLSGTRLQVERNEEGLTRIVGLPASSGRFSPPALLLIHDATVEWTDHRRDAHLVETGLDLQMLSRGATRRLLVRFRNRDLLIDGEIEGRLTGSDWSARFWMQGSDVELGPILRPYLPREVRLHSARIDFEGWSYWERGNHRATRLLFVVPEARLERRDAPPLTLSDLSADLLFRAREKGWILELDGLKLRTEGGALQQETGVALQAGEEDLLLGISELELGALAPLTRLLPLAPAQREAVEAVSPTGRLKELRFHLQEEGENSPWTARARLENLITRPWKGVPGVKELDAEFFARPGEVHMTLRSGHSSVELPRLFRQPLQLERLEGELAWRRTGDTGWVLESDRLVAENRDLRTVTRLHLAQREAGVPLFADMQTDFRDGDGAHAWLYYPVGIMKEKLVKWLDEAILFGRVSRGSFILHGPLDHFPFHKTRDGHFEVLFQADNLSLAYHQAWPPLEQASGTVRFHNNSLEIRLGQTRIYDSSVEQAVARIPSLKPLAPLEVSGVVNGPLADELRLLRETPLRRRLARKIEGIELEGDGRLEARLRIPFKSHDYRFEGTLHFKNARFLWKPQRLVLDRLTGQLEIDNHGIRGKGIGGRVLGSPIRIDVAPNEEFTRVSARGRIPARALVRQYPRLKALRPQGAASLFLDLDLPNDSGTGDGEIVLDVRSDLEGMTLDLPPPLTAPPGKPRQFSFGLRQFRQQQVYTVRLDDALGLTLTQEADRTRRLSVALSRLPLRAWIRWFDRLPAGEASRPLEVDSIRLQTDHLLARPLLADEFVLELERSGGLWQGEVESSAIRGRVRFDSGRERQRLHLDLDELRLTTSPTEHAARASETAPEIAPDPRNLALIDLYSRKFHFNQADLGELRIRSTAIPDGQAIETLETTGGGALIQAHGRWTQGKRGQATHLEGTFDTDDMGRFLREGLFMNFLAGSRAHVSFELDWPGAPYRFDLAALEGRLQLDMTAGRFLNIRPGAARILGLLNVRALGRRLKFNFKDLYAKGLAFDTILGSFQLEEGLLYTNDLEISAPSSTIRIAGSTNLARHTHDQLVTVSPRLDATLPVAGAIAGGPVAGLVVLLAQQAFSSKLEEIQRMRYAVTGPWDDPEVTPLDREPAPSPDEGTELPEQ